MPGDIEPIPGVFDQGLGAQLSTKRNNKKFTMNQLLSVRNTFKSMPCDIEPIPGVFGQGLGGDIKTKSASPNNKQFTMKQLLSVRDKFKSMPISAEPIAGVFGKGLGVDIRAESASGNNNKCTIKQLVSVGDEFKSMPLNVDPIPNVFDKGLGKINMINVEPSSPQKQRKDKQFTIEQLLSVRHNFKSMPMDTNSITNIFGKGLGKTTISNTSPPPKTTRTVEHKNKKKSFEKEVISFEEYWDEMCSLKSMKKSGKN
eukprot:132050_1